MRKSSELHIRLACSELEDGSLTYSASNVH